MPDQLTLFDVPAKPRRPPRVLMRAVSGSLEYSSYYNWRCPRCGYETGWPSAPIKVRPPCPRCNVEGLEDE